MMNVWGMTDIGLVRKENQDAYAARASGGYTICVVCDGMGGARGGQLASRLAVSTFMESCLANLTEGMSPQQVREVADFAVSAANRVVYEKAVEEPGLRGMGTTLVSAIAWDGQALLTNVGDSRAYLVRGDSAPEDRGISRITRDHSLVERLVELGDITPEEARRHPDRNLITRALGPDEAIEGDSYLAELRPGDFILLCSDGLIEYASDQEMEREILQDHGNCLNRLLEIAKRRGAADNVTAVLMRQL